MSRTYDYTLPCGCMISVEGGGGCIPCHAEYGNMKKNRDKEALKLHEKSWKKYLKSKDKKVHDKQIKELNP